MGDEDLQDAVQSEEGREAEERADEDAADAEVLRGVPEGEGGKDRGEPGCTGADLKSPMFNIVIPRDK